MEKEVVDFLHQSIEITVWLLTHPRKHVVDHPLSLKHSAQTAGTTPTHAHVETWTDGFTSSAKS